jgi:hypothetical protein
MNNCQSNVSEALREFRAAITNTTRPGVSAPDVVHRAAMERALATAAGQRLDTEDLRGRMDIDILERLNRRNLERARDAH